MEIQRSEKIALALTLVFLAIAGFYSMSLKPVSYVATIGEPIGYNAVIGPDGRIGYQQIYLNVFYVARHGDGTLISSGYTHNLLTYLGRADMRALLSGNAGVGATNSTWVSTWNYIGLVNATFTASYNSTYCAGGTDKVYRQSPSMGLNAAQGTVAIAGAGIGPGWPSTGSTRWNITNTFTLSTTPATAQVIWGACLMHSTTYGSSANNLLAEALFGSTATLSQVNDNVKVVWQITVT